MHGNAVRAASALLAAAAVWPGLLCSLGALTRSSYERALAGAWCGSAPSSSAVLGHCAACWLGVFILVFTAIVIAATGRRSIRGPIAVAAGKR
jgi:hypothetical protein